MADLEGPDDRHRRAVHENLEYVPGAACASILVLSFLPAGGGLSIAIMKAEWSWLVVVFPLFGLMFAGGMYGFFMLLRRMFGHETGPAAKKRERRLWLVAPLAGLVLGALAGAVYVAA
jgi:cobalamin synthase